MGTVFIVWRAGEEDNQGVFSRESLAQDFCREAMPQLYPTTHLIRKSDFWIEAVELDVETANYYSH